MVSAVGLWEAYRGYAVPVLVAMAVTASVLVAMWVLPFVPSDQRLTRPLVLGGLLGALLTWVTMGLGHLASYVGVLVVFLLVATAPAVRARCRPLLATARRRGAAQPTDPPTDQPTQPPTHRPTDPSLDPPADRPVAARRPEPVAVPPAVLTPAEDDPLPSDLPDAMSDAELCRAWRRSFVLLERARTSHARLHLVSMRACYLEELERRAGQAFTSWLDSGARAAGDPSRCLHPHDGGGGQPSVSD